jgi:hypothetical protein
MVRGEERDHLSIEIRPAWFSVQAEDHITLTFVYVMNAESVHFEIVGLVWKTGQICETILGCT